MLKPVALTCALLFGALLVWLRLGALLKYSIDYPQFYFAGQLVSGGPASKLYDTAGYDPLLEAAGIRRGELSSYFNRPAFAALLYRPLALFSYDTGRLIFVAMNCIIWAILIWKLPLWLGAPAHLRIALLCFYPFVESVGKCQDTLMLTLTTAFACCVLLKRNEPAAGVVLSFGLFKPHLLILMPVLLIVERRWRALQAFLISGCVLAAVSFALVGPAGIVQWLTLLAAPSTDILPERMANLRALGLQMGLPSALAAATIVVSGTVAVLWRGSYSQRLSVSILATLLLCPHVYSQDFSLTAIVALLSPHPLVRYGFLVPWCYFLPEGSFAPMILLAVAAIAVIALSTRPVPSNRYHRDAPGEQSGNSISVHRSSTFSS